jgi:hypothetical protein
LSLDVVVGALLSIRSQVLLRADRELVVHCFEVIRAADGVLIGSLDSELITHDKAHLYGER